MRYKPFCRTEIIFINKEEMMEKLFALNVTNIVLVMSESSVLRWNMASFIEKLKEKCESSYGTFIWIKKVAVNPTQRDIIKSLNQIGNNKVEIIIAFGGGSSIDTAKGISSFYNVEKNYSYKVDEITDSLKNKSYRGRRFIDIIALPSTTGTGSEVTQWATIWDENKTCKFSIDDPMLKPKMAIVVPEFTTTLSSKLTISTGLDALSHAIEAYWSKHTTPIVQEISYRSIEIIIRNLKKAVDEPHDIAIREKLCKASVLAGLAFSQTRTTACHSISYPLTMLYGMPHGLATSITLNEVAKINKGHFQNDGELFDLFSRYGSIKNWIDMVCEGVINMQLSSFGITEKDIPIIANNAFTRDRIDNNPVCLCKYDVINILMKIL